MTTIVSNSITGWKPFFWHWVGDEHLINGAEIVKYVGVRSKRLIIIDICMKVIVFTSFLFMCIALVLF